MMIEWLNEGLTKGQFILFVLGCVIGIVIATIMRKAWY